MPIFTQSLQRIDYNNPQDAIKKMVNHIKYIQEQLEYTLLNLDSGNITEIDIDKTTIGDSTGTTNIGSYINLAGSNGESFKVGRNSKGRFEFSICGKNGTRAIFLDENGELQITSNTILTVDGGDW